jgi:hypothetical protein
MDDHPPRTLSSRVYERVGSSFRASIRLLSAAALLAVLIELPCVFPALRALRAVPANKGDVDLRRSPKRSIYPEVYV